MNEDDMLPEDELPEGEGVVMAEIEPKRLDSVRTQLPALRHRKL